MKWKILNAYNFSYEGSLEDCINNALAYTEEYREKNYFDCTCSPAVVKAAFEDEEDPDTQYYAIGWYYNDSRYHTLQFQEECRIVKSEQEATLKPGDKLLVTGMGYAVLSRKTMNVRYTTNDKDVFTFRKYSDGNPDRIVVDEIVGWIPRHALKLLKP